MNRKYRLLLSLMLPVTVALAAEIPLDFNREIRPILSDKCFACHGPDKKNRKGKLRLDLEESAKDPKKSAVVPGNPKESELIYHITTDDEEELMPPVDSGKSLTTKEKELLRRWIAEGASWSEHWAYVPPRKHELPTVKKTRWPANWIDHFALRHMEQSGQKPAPDADSITLVRRLYFDLAGLPPEPGVVDVFSKTPTPKAYEALVDRLLASEHYGERMASYWLDLVRFADTVGYHGDQDHSISPYRDWVIDAFNDDLPFDQFTREQLAGDLLPKATTDQIIATGYNRLLQTSHEGGVQPKEYIAMYAADRVRNLSEVWMGTTMGCAQCHEHKFDPFEMKDFYSLAAFFADIDDTTHLTKGSNSLPTRREPEISVLDRDQREQLAKLDKIIATKEALQKKTPDPAIAAEIKTLQSKRVVLQKTARKTMITRAIKPRVTRLLPRGNWLDETGPIVEPAVPEFHGQIKSGKRLTRLDLANWLTNPEQGIGTLNARVLVNRIWYLLFGRG